MDLVEQFEATWYTHECVLNRGAGDGPYGPTPGEPYPFQGRVTQKTVRVMGTQGEEQVTTTTVQCNLAVPADIGDTITLPDPFHGTWDITERSAHEGVPNMHPHHQKLTLTAHADDTPTDPYPDDPYGEAGPYG